MFLKLHCLFTYFTDKLLTHHQTEDYGVVCQFWFPNADRSTAIPKPNLYGSFGRLFLTIQSTTQNQQIKRTPGYYVTRCKANPRRITYGTLLEMARHFRTNDNDRCSISNKERECRVLIFAFCWTTCML